MNRSQFLVRIGFLCIAALGFSCSSPVSTAEEKGEGFLYLINRSSYTVTLQNLSIDGTAVDINWRIRARQSTALSVDPITPLTLRRYPRGTIISFTYSWTYADRNLRQTMGATINGTKTVRLYDAPSAEGWVVYKIELGDTRSQP